MASLPAGRRQRDAINRPLDLIHRASFDLQHSAGDLGVEGRRYFVDHVLDRDARAVRATLTFWP
jgi:hypothetical protein